MTLADISVPIEFRCRKRDFSGKRLHALRFCMISGTDRQLSAVAAHFRFDLLSATMTGFGISILVGVAVVVVAIVRLSNAKFVGATVFDKGRL